MWLFFLTNCLAAVLLNGQDQTNSSSCLAADQLACYQENSSHNTLTTLNGAPVDIQDIKSTNADLINDFYFMETITHLNRERIPERVVHAKGTGAHGYFTLTEDISSICKAKIFTEVGNSIPVSVRFSTDSFELGSADTVRDFRGMAVKFRTEEGNFDLLGLNVQMFSIKSPTGFPALVHAFKRNPRTHLMDYNMRWDFLINNPQAMNMFLRFYGKEGIPDGFRCIPGYPLHVYQLYNDAGKISYVKFQIEPEGGEKFLTADVATKLAGTDPDYATKDLYNAIAEGNYPAWQVKIQVAPQEDVQNISLNLFDVTLAWSEDTYPPKTIGRLVLNKNPVNSFSEIELLAFCPSNLVPGVLGGADKMFQARRLAYKDAQYYRLGANFEKIPTNSPERYYTYNRDGVAPVLDNEGDGPNYFPNSFNGPTYNKDNAKPALQPVYVDPNTTNLEQAAEYYNSLDDADTSALVQAMVEELIETTKYIQDKAVELFNQIDKDLSKRVQVALKSNQ